MAKKETRNNMLIRLDKLLAHSGYGTRKEVKQLIRKGYVSVDEEVIYNDDYKVDTLKSEISVFDEDALKELSFSRICSRLWSQHVP